MDAAGRDPHTVGACAGRCGRRPLDRVYEVFQDFHDYCAPVFGRKQWRERSGQYLQALLVQSQERGQRW